MEALVACLQSLDLVLNEFDPVTGMGWYEQLGQGIVYLFQKRSRKNVLTYSPSYNVGSTRDTRMSKMCTYTQSHNATRVSTCVCLKYSHNDVQLTRYCRSIHVAAKQALNILALSS